MNREIKFRGWNNVNNKMIYWKDLVGNKEVLKSFFGNEAFMSNPPRPIWNRMQYTELVDKNGVEIYEGDICIYILDTKPFEDELDLSNLKELKGVVEYHKCYFHLTGLEYKPMLSNYCINEIEVIGNIYENPELIK